MIEKSIWGKAYDLCFSIEIFAQSESWEDGKVEYVAEFIVKSLKEPEIIVHSDIKELVRAVYSKIQSEELQIPDKIKNQFISDRGTIISMALDKVKELEEELKVIRECKVLDKVILEDKIL